MLLLVRAGALLLRGCAALLTHRSIMFCEKFLRYWGGSNTGITETGLASRPASLPCLIPLLCNWSCTCTTGVGALDLMILRHRACKYLLIYIFRVILCCKFTWYVVCHKTKTFYCDVIKKFVLLRSKSIIAVFCGLFKGFYLVVR